MEAYLPIIFPCGLLWAFWCGIWIGRKTRRESAIEIAYREAKQGGADKLLIHLK